MEQLGATWSHVELRGAAWHLDDASYVEGRRINESERRELAELANIVKRVLGDRRSSERQNRSLKTGGRSSQVVPKIMSV